MSAAAPAPLRQAPQPADATRLLFERHSGRIFGFCLSLLGSREDAEDAVQTTFLRAQRGLGRGSAPRFELAWLFKIARNVCNDRHQSTWRRGRIESTRDLDSLQDVLATPERAAVSVDELTRALAEIPERQRRALVLREWRGLSYDEIAAELGVSVPAVETLLFRARRSVAAQLEQSGTVDRRGAVASLLSLFSWLFRGSAAPLKIAAATATVAATAGIAVVPAIRDHKPSPGPAPAGSVTQRTDAGRGVTPSGVIDRGTIPRSGVRTPATRTRATSVVPDTSTPAEGSARPASDVGDASRNPAGGGATPPTSVPSDSTPSVTAPAVTTPSVTVPEVSVPTVNVPAVEVPPVQVEPLDTPDLPTLP